MDLWSLPIPGRMVFMEKPRITFFDTTLRDGEQAPGCSMGVYDKLRMARQLDELGRPVIAGLARASEPDIRRAWAALETARRPRIHVFLASSDLHLQCKLKI